MAYNITIHKKNDVVLRNNNTTSFVTCAPKGKTGSDGPRGTSLYFANYDLTNDYYKDIVLQKISNNIMLSSDADIKQEGREYINGDLILCSDKTVYMIKKENDIYDIELIGKIQDNNVTNDFKDKIINVLIEVFPSSGTVGVTSPLSFDTENHATNAPSLFIKGMVYTTSDTNYDYYLKIYLHNKKTLQLGDYAFKEGISDENTVEYDLSLTNNCIDFYKKLEFKLTEVSANEDGEFDVRDIETNANISSLSMDKLHPSGNNFDAKISSIYNIRYDSSLHKYNIETKPSEFSDNTNYTDLHTNVQFTKRKVDDTISVNFLGGESCYFSGMSKNANTINDYFDVSIYGTDHCKMINNEMFNFINSSKNIYELICVNKISKKIEIVNLNDSNISYKIKNMSNG